MNPFNPNFPLRYGVRFGNGVKRWIQLSPEAMTFFCGVKPPKKAKKGKRFRYYKAKMYKKRKLGLFWSITKVVQERIEGMLEYSLFNGLPKE